MLKRFPKGTFANGFAIASTTAPEIPLPKGDLGGSNLKDDRHLRSIGNHNLSLPRINQATKQLALPSSPDRPIDCWLTIVPNPFTQ
jgi:hypothetical protein